MTNELPVENSIVSPDKVVFGQLNQPVGVDQSPAPVMGVPGGITRSPSPIIRESARAQGEMNFYEALAKVASGFKITRISWNDKDCYAQMHEAFLYLKEAETKKFSIWGISEGDMIGTDYIVIG